MAPKRVRRRMQPGDTEMITESSSGSDSEKKRGKSKTTQRRSSARLSKNKKSVDSSSSIDSAYDGDGETTCSTNEMTSSSSDNTMSSPSSDMYDFDEEEEVQSRGILSPKQPNVKKKTKRKTPAVKQTKNTSKSDKSSRNSLKLVNTSVTPTVTKDKSNIENKHVRKPKGMKTPGVSPILSSSSSRLDSPFDTPLEYRGKRKSPLSVPNITPCIGTKSKNPRIDQIKNDSGVFVSPPQKIPKIVAKDTSTPSNVKDVDVRGDKCFGFDWMGSPVHGVTTSDYGSAVMDISQISMDDSIPSSKDFEVTMFSEPESVPEPDINLNRSVSLSYKASKQKRPKGRYSIGKLDKWAEKMNQEFDEAENFELSIEG